MTIDPLLFLFKANAHNPKQCEKLTTFERIEKGLFSRDAQRHHNRTGTGDKEYIRETGYTPPCQSERFGAGHGLGTTFLLDERWRTGLCLGS